MLQPTPVDPRVSAVDALDEFIAEIVRTAHERGICVPPRLFDWAVGEGSWVVERLASRCVPEGEPPRHELDAALRCAVRRWVAPYIASHFACLCELSRELERQAVCCARQCALRLCER